MGHHGLSPIVPSLSTPSGTLLPDMTNSSDRALCSGVDAMRVYIMRIAGLAGIWIVVACPPGAGTVAMVVRERGACTR